MMPEALTKILQTLGWIGDHAFLIFCCVLVTSLTGLVLYSLHLEKQRFNFDKRKRKKP